MGGVFHGEEVNAFNIKLEICKSQYQKRNFLIDFCKFQYIDPFNQSREQLDSIAHSNNFFVMPK